MADERNNITTYTYDAAGRMLTTKDALGRVTTYAYDLNGRRISTTDANLHVTQYAYDPRGRLTTVTFPDNTAVHYTYDLANNQLTMTDQAGEVTTRSYDVAGRLSSVADALQQSTSFAYDANNNLLQITDAAGHATSFGYDNVNRQTSRTLPLGMTETRAYDPAGNLATRTDFAGRTTTFAYDALNRLVTKTPQNQPAVTFTYTPTGKRASMVDSSGTTSYSYDNRDRLLSKVTPEGTLTYTYDAAGNVKTIVSSNASGASMSYSYDALNRLATATDNRLLAQGATSAVTSYSYDLVGNVASYTYPNSVQTTHTYNALNRLTQLSAIKGSSLANFAYTLGAAGNRLSVAELGGRTVNYGYDGNYRLTSEAITADPASNNGSINYTYDQVGNRTQISSTLAAIAGGSFSYDANDRLTSDSYDANGNTLASAGVSNTYDFENRLVQHGGVSITYDGDGNRVAESVNGLTTQYLVDDLNPTGYPQVVDELLGGVVSRTYAYGRTRISQNQLQGNAHVPSFYGYDGHGNVRFLTNSAGAVTDTYQFDAFGNRISSTGSTLNDFLFSQEQSDNFLNLYYLRARYYNPASGRFITMDPEAGNINDPGTLHKYLYTRNNPVNSTDPTGRQDLEEYAYELAHLGLEIHHAYELAACERDLLQFDADALNAAFNGTPLDPGAGTEAVREFVKCFFDANVWPWGPFIPLN
jgi:RHS repeat-associated protein